MATSMTTGGTNAFDALALQDSLRENIANTALSSGMTLFSQKKYTQAAQAFKQAAAMNPALAEAYTYLGYTQIRLGKKQDAVKTLNLALKVDKTQDQVYSDLANLYIDLKQTSDAEKTVKNAISVNNQNTLAYYTLGQLQAQRKDYVDAEKNFRTVIRLEPKDGNGYYALGMALNGQGKHADAIKALKTAVSLKKNFVPALSELGEAYAAVGDDYNAQQQLAALNKISSADADLAARNLKATLTKPGISYIVPSGTTFETAHGPKTQLTALMPLDPDKYTANPVQADPATDPLYFAEGSKSFTVKIAFSTEMNAKSVQNIANWSITKASGGRAGVYNNGLYSATNVAIPAIPQTVLYDPVKMEASLTFSLRQHSFTLQNDTVFDKAVWANGQLYNAGDNVPKNDPRDPSGNTLTTVVDGTIDPSHLIFKFMGTDANGKLMDENADQVEGAGGIF